MEDVYYIIDNMRKEDIEECYSFAGGTPKDVLTHGFKSAKECIVGIENNIVICIVGVSKDNQIWMLFSNKVTSISPSFLKESIKMVKESISKYDFIHGYTQSSNEFIIKFVKILGFSIEPEQNIRGFNIVKYHKRK